WGHLLGMAQPAAQVEQAPGTGTLEASYGDRRPGDRGYADQPGSHRSIPLSFSAGAWAPHHADLRGNAALVYSARRGAVANWPDLCLGGPDLDDRSVALSELPCLGACLAGRTGRFGQRRFSQRHGLVPHHAGLGSSPPQGVTGRGGTTPASTNSRYLAAPAR